MTKACAWAAVLALAISSGAAAAKPRAPQRAPSFQLPASTGTAALDSLRGQVVLVDFWASWCTPCRASFPWMNAMVERYGKRGLSVVAINLDKERAAADHFLADHPASFTVAYDPAGKTAEAYGVAAMPTSFLVGKDGALLYSHAGFDPKKTAPVESLIVQKLAP